MNASSAMIFLRFLDDTAQEQHHSLSGRMSSACKSGPTELTAPQTAAHRSLSERMSVGVQSDPTELTATQTAAWPWVRAGVASNSNYPPNRRQRRANFWGARGEGSPRMTSTNGTALLGDRCRTDLRNFNRIEGKPSQKIVGPDNGPLQ